MVRGSQILDTLCRLGLHDAYALPRDLRVPWQDISFHARQILCWHSSTPLCFSKMPVAPWNPTVCLHGCSNKVWFSAQATQKIPSFTNTTILDGDCCLKYSRLVLLLARSACWCDQEGLFVVSQFLSPLLAQQQQKSHGIAVRVSYHFPSTQLCAWHVVGSARLTVGLRACALHSTPCCCLGICVGFC